MATLSQVYSNLAIGGVVMTTSFIAFGVAVGLGANKNLAPRAWARPIKVLKNCLSRPYSLSWISWAMSLRYIDLLSGIPGTGTREGGRSGPTLKTNLDGIVLLRYHTLQFKVSALATVLAMLLLLPMYYTSPCFSQVSGIQKCNEIRGLSDFEKITITNVVPHYRVKAVSENGTSTLLDEYLNTTGVGLDEFLNSTTTGNDDEFELGDFNLINSVRFRWISGISERYLACAVSIILITVYTCYLLWHEWIECLALRRVYYLESDYYEERIVELDEILCNGDPEDPFQKIRPPFLPHPEMRETVPNISLHSALFKLPNKLCTKSGANEDDKCLMDRQLQAAAVFFDQCIPAQRGFTSSIVAVSLVPDAKKLTKVWGRWYVLGNILRRIRYIKRHLEIRKEMRRTGKRGLYDFFVEAPVSASGRAFHATNESIEAVSEKNHDRIGCTHDEKETKSDEEPTETDETSSRTVLMSGSMVIDPVSKQDSDIADIEAGFDTTKRKAMYASSSGKRHSFEYEGFDPIAFAKWLGYTEETKLKQVIDTLEIEQMSVFARETSQSASNPCVYGMAPEALRFKSIETLETMLADAWESAHEVNDELLAARAEMFRKVKKVDVTSIGKSERKSLSELEENEGQGEQETPTNLVTIPESENVEYSEDFSPTSNFGKETSHRPNGLRQRGRQKSSREKYKLAQEIVKESNRHISDSRAGARPCCPSMKQGCLGRGTSVAKSLKQTLLDHPSYCVVTFTCRQAAVAARQCLADGRGLQSWEQVSTIPMNPLADAPPLTPFFCRGCCRPVTLTIPTQERRTRKIIVWTLYVLFCFFYTIPLTFVSQITHPTWLAAAFPDIEILQDPDNFFFRILAGFSSGYIYTVFFSVLPQVFKILAMSEGTSSSKVDAEEQALRFYWYFMLVTAFTGGYLVNMLIASIVEGNVSDEVRDILGNVAATMASEQAPVWLNWIIVRTFTTLPLVYLLQILTFFYGCIRIHWLNRVMKGGGPGGPPPYRIYIDSGVVFMCITSLAPIVPIVAPAACLYYIIFIPILRWLHIFVYRPFYDGGGSRLPIIHEIIISSLILGQMLLGTVLLLKQSFILGSIIVFMPIPTYLFSLWTKEKFQRSYEDAALWQTSNLDGLAKHGTTEEREKYRRWLVDCHKASYVPICLSGGEDFLTIQPAVVVPLDNKPVKRFSAPRERSWSAEEFTQGGALSKDFPE